MIYYGASWYPEQWSDSEWSRDLQQMREARMNAVILTRCPREFFSTVAGATNDSDEVRILLNTACTEQAVALAGTWRDFLNGATTIVSPLSRAARRCGTCGGLEFVAELTLHTQH